MSDSEENITEEADAGLIQLSESMPNLPPDVQEAFDIYKAWIEEHDPYLFIEKGDEEGYARLKSFKPEYIATGHSTCENEQLTVGVHEFSPANCCWHEFGWHVLRNPSTEDDYVETSMHAPCADCNIGGDDEGGDLECGSCYGDGWLTYYFDDYLVKKGSDSNE